MFTIEAVRLAAILDKVTPHRPAGPDMDHLDVVVLDCTRRWLHAAAGGDRTLAVARTRVDGAAHWIAPVAFDEISALRGWLESSRHVRVENMLDSGLPRLRFSEGAAQITVPIATYAADLPWRELLRAEAQPTSYARAAVRLSAADLALWEHAGEEVDIRHGAMRAALVVRGTNFIGLQMPRPGAREGEALAGWAASLRAQCFLHEGVSYEVGARYADRFGCQWLMPARPAPGEEPVVVLADRSGVVLPLTAVLAVGGSLLRLPA
ncbi:hypothetical protein J7E87_15055 [Streptomyces sp. ISL-1]|uniref:hypothetical protein n=1 Tax=Streptomyces sp. ISL-1 TaxID=2817657 RepID=UPI001BE76054|nr:hypothetical protein [Streptomyces sp. ISL-1]MBT2390708.1 hypothetical protein [Streptomyces sp. ISL-1]